MSEFAFAFAAVSLRLRCTHRKILPSSLCFSKKFMSATSQPATGTPSIPSMCPHSLVRLQGPPFAWVFLPLPESWPDHLSEMKSSNPIGCNVVRGIQSCPFMTGPHVVANYRQTFRGRNCRAPSSTERTVKRGWLKEHKT